MPGRASYAMGRWNAWRPLGHGVITHEIQTGSYQLNYLHGLVND